MWLLTIKHSYHYYIYSFSLILTQEVTVFAPQNVLYLLIFKFKYKCASFWCTTDFCWVQKHLASVQSVGSRDFPEQTDDREACMNLLSGRLNTVLYIYCICHLFGSYVTATQNHLLSPSYVTSYKSFEPLGLLSLFSFFYNFAASFQTFCFSIRFK